MDYDSFVTRLRITRSYLANHPTHGSWEEAGVVEQAADAIVALRSDLAAAQATERRLRHLLFLAHGSAEHYLYGDDGERNCNTCMIDFNADSPSVIWQKITDYRNRKHAIAAAKGEG